MAFEEEHLTGTVCSFANIPDQYYDDDSIACLDHYDVRDALNESADYVDEDIFEGPPAMSGAYFKVYAQSKEGFRQKITTRLLDLLKSVD